MQVTGLSSSFAAYEPVIPAQAGIHLSDFTATLNSLLFPSLNSALAVALSGGADSMALALLANDFARARGSRIIALTVDHALRAGSREEAEQVAAWMAARGIAHHILTPPHLDHHKNMQESARIRRYDALADWCRGHDVLHCLLAHHAGDQAETVALMQARGDTADGAAGMSAMRNYRGVRFLRPLLGMAKEDLKKYLLTRAAGWVEDPSNVNPKFARVRMRGALSTNATERAALLTTARTEGEARAERDNALAEAAASLVSIHPAGFAELPLSAWGELAPTLASQLIADLLTTISGKTHRPRAHETERLCAALRGEAPLRRTLHGCEISANKNTLRIAREAARVTAPMPLRGEGTLRWDERYTIRYALAEDTELTLRALGRDGIAALKKISPTTLPEATPSLWHLDKLVYAPHIYHALPEGAEVRVGFAPAKPLAAAPFWWLNDRDT